mgnify:FL=1
MPILSNFPGGAGSGSGGLTLAAVSGITTQVSSGKVYVKWTDPDDLVVAGSTIAAWGGTLLVRKAGSAPTSRRDGTIVLDSKTRDAYKNTYFCDSGLSNGTKYYYKFFPYTTANAYTDSTDDEFNAIPTVQVAGITSWNVTGMSASSEAGNGKMTVKWTDPSASISADGVTLASWASTTIVVKSGSYPTSKDDSGAVYTLKVTTRNRYSSTPLTITGLTNGTKYYIAFFPETTDGGINTSTSQRTTGTANRITIANVPAQSGTLTYNKSSQSPSWSNYNTTYMTIGGTTSGTNAGNYTASFTPKTDYRWSDGATTAKNVVWSIGKATGTLTVSKTTIKLSLSKLTDTFTIGGNHDGTLSVTSSATGVATVSRSGNTVTVSHVNQTNGEATITVSCTAGTNYSAPASKTVKVTAEFILATLNDNSWAAIHSVSGTGASYWAVGDRKAVTVNGTVGTQAVNGTYYAYIIGFNHNSSKEGNGITFGTFKTALSGGTDICLVDGKYDGYSTNGTKYFNMNHSSNTNAGGWKGCDLRYDVLGSTNTNDGDATATTATNPVANTLMAALPSDLRAVMQPMTIYTDNTGGGSDNASYVTKTTDYLPLLAEYEIFGTRSYANSAEKNYQAQYAYYSAGNSKVKYRHSATSSTAWWWERSPNYNNSNNFCNVNTNGNANNNNARNSNGVAPDFVNQKWSGSIVVAQRVNYDPYERRNTSRDESPKLPFDILTRTPPEYPCVHGERCILPRFMCHELSRLDDALQDICTEGE